MSLRRAVAVAVGTAALLSGRGCGDTAQGADLGTGPVADLARPAVDLVAAGDAGATGPDLGCYANARQYYELLNACTNARAIDKLPVTPLLRPDGTLPPLP